jgi:UDPglucose 6-dehydrogenase
MSDVLIIGYGVVGKDMGRIFPHADVFDPGQGYHIGEMVDVTTFGNEQPEHRSVEGDRRWAVGFICVPTPKLPSGAADTAIVESAVRQWSGRCDALVIKSTVPPGFTDSLIDEGIAVCMSPEFTGATLDSKLIDDDFVIIGGRTAQRRLVAEVYKRAKPSTFRIHFTDAITAELVKYAENAFLATKVTFFNEWARICETFGVEYDEWRELLLNDPRIGRSHTQSYAGQRYYDSHCLNKDIPAIVRASRDRGYLPSLLEVVDALNADWRAER